MTDEEEKEKNLFEQQMIAKYGPSYVRHIKRCREKSKIQDPAFVANLKKPDKQKTIDEMYS